ncbi:hypothetical protein BJ166DRAFT_538323 [Pestalotiopsis sp. NC0098]|nr:hypothetical protein BJ166DRAFT_538323 [Pestalotiopsis sp. NC0098]
MFGHRSSDESAGTADSKEHLLHKSRDADDEVQWAPIRPTRRSFSHVGHLIVELFLVAVIVVVFFYPLQIGTKHRDQVIYSPASEAISYHVRGFNAGYLPGEKSPYQLDCPTCTPTDSIDDAWAELYSPWMWSKIPRNQAAQLNNLTINIPGEEDQYLIGLDVFHQLHCLDNIRRGLWPDRYRHEDYMGGQGMSLLSAKHLDHCVDQIRQVIMCASDVSTNWLRWDEEWQSNMPPGFTYHSCRNFDAVVDWAREHTVEPFDLKIRTPDPLQQE